MPLITSKVFGSIKTGKAHSEEQAGKKNHQGKRNGSFHNYLSIQHIFFSSQTFYLSKW